MRKSIAATLAAICATAALVGIGEPAQSSTQDAAKGGRGHYATVNGLRMYYEVHGKGKGRPLVLLHGAFSATGTSFGQLLPTLAKTREVISVEQQAHGHTADIDEDEGHAVGEHRQLRLGAVAQDPAGPGPPGVAGAPAPGGLRVLLPRRGAALR